MKQGLVFGVFDLLHPGHQWFLLEALKHCDHLTVIVAQDDDVARRKGRHPKQTLEQRIKKVQAACPNMAVIAGDAQEGEWSIFEKLDIDCCILGYDQSELQKVLEQFKNDRKLSFEIIILKPYFPERFKSSMSS